MTSFVRKGILACAPATVRGEPTPLDASPKGDKFLYCNSRTVVIRSLDNPSISEEYTQHLAPVSVARFSPSGYYIASGDATGVVRAWDCTQPEKILKLESKPLSNKIYDIAWDSESQRLMAVGDGRDKFGHVFLLDSGSSAGEVMGHSRTVSSCAFRPSGRPFRAVTASHDFKVNFYTGAPYKFNRAISDHTNIVHCVKYSPSGDTFISAGADSKIFIYDGLTGDLKGDFNSGNDQHKGSIFATAWSPDSTQFITSSGDSTVKLWDVESKICIQTFSFGSQPSIENQQVGNLWAGSHMVSLSLSGNINYLDPRTTDPSKIIKGHQKGINSIASSYDPQFPTLFTGSYDGRVYNWDVDSLISSDSCHAVEVTGSGHTNKVNGMCFNDSSKDGLAASVGMDDTFRLIDIKSSKFIDTTLSLKSEPIGISSGKTENGVNFFAVATKDNSLYILSSEGKELAKTSLPSTPISIASRTDKGIVAVSVQGKSVQLYQFDGSKLDLVGTPGVDVGIDASTICFSPDNTLFVLSNSNGKLFLYDVSSSDFELKTSRWAFHTARVHMIKFSADSKYAVSGGLDGSIYLWSVNAPGKKVAIPNAHVGSVTGVSFLTGDDDQVLIASVGSDASVKTWSITLPK